MKKQEKVKVTAESLRALMEQGIEPSEPVDSILAYLKSKNGKTLTKRDIPKLRAIKGAEDTLISHRAGMTRLEWGGYARSGGEKGGSLLIAYTEDAPVIDARLIEIKYNACHFSARVARNKARAEVLADTGIDPFERAASAINAILQARETIEALSGYGQPLHEISSEISYLLEE